MITEEKSTKGYERDLENRENGKMSNTVVLEARAKKVCEVVSYEE
jgi:hypothetical protein